MIVNGFENGFHQWIQRIFLVVVEKMVSEIFLKSGSTLRFFNSGYAHDRSISIFRRRAFLRTGNTLIKPNYASVSQSRDSLDHDRHNVTKKSRGGAVL